MYGPPAASVKVQRSSRLGRVLAALSLVFLGSPALAYAYGLPILYLALVLLVWLLASAAMLVVWRNAPTGRLFWDGERWHWSGHAEPLQAVAIQYDFQQSVWVLLEPARGRRFGLWLDADPRQPEEWRAMRRALVGASDRRAVYADTL
jgi:hypothetical protein